MTARKRPELTRPPNLLQHGKSVGPIRSQRPIYKDLLPPCNRACPAGENIQGWLSHARAGRDERAWQEIMKDNPLPAVHGRVCYHPCETACNRAEVDSAVNIHAVERFLGDRALREGWRVEPIRAPSKKRVLVVGAGPSGLSAAFHLTRLGHEVRVCEAGPVAGGMMHFGIPAYRLPRRELSAEVENIERMGVEIAFNYKVENLLAEIRGGGFDAAFVAVGAHISKRVDIPARDASRIFDAVNVLRDAATGEAPALGRRVAIYGGGDTAMDAARTAKRLGADEAMIVYRRDAAHMPAHASEAEGAAEEGVKMNWLRTIREVDERGIQVEIMELGDEGYPRPTGRFESLEADSVILALGQDSDTSFLRDVPGLEFKRDGTVVVGRDFMTGYPGVFAGGDMVPDERTVTVAVGHGKKAARHIDAYLRGARYEPAPKRPLAGFEKLRLWYLTDAETEREPAQDPRERTYNFQEIVKGLGEAEARYEAERCYSCGNCFECDACFAACPEDAIVKLGPWRGYEIDFDRCTGCAVCYETCPVHAIEMIPEPPANSEEPRE